MACVSTLMGLLIPGTTSSTTARGGMGLFALMELVSKEDARPAPASKEDRRCLSTKPDLLWNHTIVADDMVCYLGDYLFQSLLKFPLSLPGRDARIFVGKRKSLASNFLEPWCKWHELGNLQKGQQPKDGNQS